MAKKRKICVVTGTRAEYGLLYWLMHGLRDHPDFELQVCAAGMHLSPEFGLTYKQIEDDGFEVNSKVEMLLSGDTEGAIARSTGLGMIGYAGAFEQLKPDLVVVLGDRFELLAAASTALFFRIPVAHLHGGEVTEGAFDEAIRHSLTKMSHLHFTCAEPYRNRVLQLGEDPNHVYNVGGLGIDNIVKLPLLEKDELSAQLEWDLRKQNLMVTYHPVTLEGRTASDQFEELLASLAEFDTETGLIFTLPNADTHGRSIIDAIEEFVGNSKGRAAAFTSLGQLRYLSALKHCDAVVGNSSSGLLEAPSFGVATINIGNRQAGRLRAESVIDCGPSRKEITSALNKAVSNEFRQVCKNAENPYGSGGAADKIISALEKTKDFQSLITKKFRDLS